MLKFEYSFFARSIYRYANIPATFILLIHFAVSIAAISHKWYFAVAAAINALVIYLLNRYYFRSYKTTPYVIEIDNEKMICSDFMFSSKRYEITLIDIDKIAGGIFSGSPTRPLLIHDGSKDLTVSVSQHIKGFNKLLTIILSNIKKELYTELMKEIEERGQKRKSKK